MRLNKHIIFIVVLLSTMILEGCQESCELWGNCQNFCKPDKIAEIFHVEPSWEVLRTNLYTQVFISGMNRSEVHQILDKVGSWRIKNEKSLNDFFWDPKTINWVFKEEIAFTDKCTHYGLNMWEFYYDNSNKLIRAEIRYS